MHGGDHPRPGPTTMNFSRGPWSYLCIVMCVRTCSFERVLLSPLCGRAERCPIYSNPDEFMIVFVDMHVQLLNMRPVIKVEEN